MSTFAAVECIDRLNRSREEREYLRKISHGHVFPFGPFSECECGISRIDYFMQSHTIDHPPCRAAQARLLDQETAGAGIARIDRCYRGKRGENESQV